MKTRYSKNPFLGKGQLLCWVFLSQLLLMSSNIHGQIAEWTFENISSAVPSLPISPSKKDPRVRASATLKGGNNNGSPDACSGNEAWSSNFWPTGSSRDPGSYLEFSVKADPGENFEIGYFSFSSNASSGSSALKFEVYYSKNNFITSKKLLSGTQSTGGCSSHGGSVGVPLYSGSTIRFRIFPYGQAVAAQAATIRIDNVSVTGSLLPVTLSAFDGRQSDNVIKLFWTTATELNNDHFVVERSQDGIYFEEIGNVAGIGTSQQEHHYQFKDPAPYPGDNYYRLRQVDHDGSEEVHPIIHINFKGESAAPRLRVWPTVASGQIHLQLAETQELRPLFIRDMNGKLIRSLQFNEENRSLVISVAELQSGWYMIQYRTARALIIRRFYKA